MTKEEYVKNVAFEINEKFQNSFVNKFLSPTSTSLYLSFSRSKDFHIFINLENSLPFIKVIDQKLNFNSNSSFYNDLKNKIFGAFFINAYQINEDNILALKFQKQDDVYEKHDYILVFELFKGNDNLILLESDKIINAFRYHGLDSNHPIIQGLTYDAPFKSLTSKPFNIESKIDSFLDNLYSEYLNEKYLNVVLFVKRKQKSLKNKLNNLNEDKKEAEKYEIYKEYGDLILENLDLIKKGDKSLNINGQNIALKVDFTPIENSQSYYKKYKKLKASFNLVDSYINETETELEYLDNILKMIPFYNEDDFIELNNELIEKYHLKKSNQKLIKNSKNPAEPYYFLINSTKIGYGKNSKQNNTLTFKKALRNDIFIHIKDYSGAHVVIFEENPSDKIIEIALELALYLSSLKDGDVYLAKIKDVKKTPTLGKVNLLKYETYHIGNIKHDIKNLIINSKRF